MKASATFVVVASMIAVTSASQGPTIGRTFTEDKPGTTPSGFSLTSMRQPSPGLWTIRRQGPQSFLVHESDASSGYALAIVDGAYTGNVEVSARVRLAGGSRTAGLVWRYQDEQNFYAVLLDLVGRQLSMYRFTSGNRVRLEVENNLELDVEAWHTLKVVYRGREVRVMLGGVRVFEDDDRRSTRSADAGRIGLVATGGTEAWFDDLNAEPRNDPTERQ